MAKRRSRDELERLLAAETRRADDAVAALARRRERHAGEYDAKLREERRVENEKRATEATAARAALLEAAAGSAAIDGALLDALTAPDAALRTGAIARAVEQNRGARTALERVAALEIVGYRAPLGWSTAAVVGIGLMAIAGIAAAWGLIGKVADAASPAGSGTPAPA